MPYKFQKTKDERWGIYFEGRLLATVGNYAVCQCIGENTTKKLSSSDSVKTTIAYRKAIDCSLVIN